MGGSKFDSQLLELKRKKFFEVVYITCKSRGLPLPTVNFDGCPGEDENQLAHYHPIGNRICVSDRQLTKLNFDNIEHTATHEVAHILEHNHGAGFQSEHEINSIGAFRPPPGVLVISENGSKPIKKPSRPVRVDTKRCNYHICREKTALYKCKLCESFFCSDHSNPRLSGMPTFKGIEPEDLLNESDESNSHPCPPYYDYLQKIDREEKAKYGEALKKLLKKPAQNYSSTRNENISQPDAYEPNRQYALKFDSRNIDTPFITKTSLQKERINTKNQAKSYKPLVFVILLLIIAYFVIFNYKNIILIFS